MATIELLLSLLSVCQSMLFVCFTTIGGCHSSSKNSGMSKSSRSGGEIDSEGFKRLDEDEPGNYSCYYYIPPNDDKQIYPIGRF